MRAAFRARLCASLACALLLAVPMAAHAQSSVSLTATPANVAPGGTVTLDASVTAAGINCGSWNGCAIIGVQGYLQISGSNGYYTSTSDPYSTGQLTLPGSDAGPGQTLQPVTYTASGGFHYDLCYYEPGFEEFGCVYGYGSADESGSAYANVGPAVAPTAVSVSPASGGGARQGFVFNYSSSLGNGDITQTWQIFHQYGQGSQSCVVGFYRDGMTFVLWGDNGWQDQQSAGMNTPVVLENSQCRLHMLYTTVAGIGDELSVVLDVSFKSGYFGPKAVTSYGYSPGGGYGAPLVGYWTARPHLNTLTEPVLPTERITLTGAEFGASGTVLFNVCDGTGIAGTVFSWDANSIDVQVPTTAVTGPVCVVVNEQASNSAALTVESGIVITAVSPRWGPPTMTALITISGLNFGSAPGTVWWGTTPVAHTAWSPTSVTLQLPAGATTALLKVVRAGVESNTFPFEVGDEGAEYYHTDGIGSVRMVTGHAGVVLERHDYKPFGEEWPPRPDEAHIGFGGKEKDQETGNGSWMALNYFGARSLHTASGRFISTDPVLTVSANIIDPQRWNRYPYVRNNPVRYVDPDGRQLTSVERAIERDNRELLTRQISEAEWKARQQARGGGAAVGATAVVIAVLAPEALAVLYRFAPAVAVELTRRGNDPKLLDKAQALLEFLADGNAGPTVSISELTATHGLRLSKRAMGRLSESIAAEGIHDTIKYVVHQGEKYIVDGHHRVAAARRLAARGVSGCC